MSLDYLSDIYDIWSFSQCQTLAMPPGDREQTLRLHGLHPQAACSTVPQLLEDEVMRKTGLRWLESSRAPEEESNTK